jgi:HEAT repeat protein
MSAHAGVDETLIALFEWDPAADERLAGFGPEAFHRVMELYRERPDDYPQRLIEVMSRIGRESLDHWSHAISIVAFANPGIYVDQLTEPLGTLDTVILGTIEDERVVGILGRALDRDDWLIRYHAVRSLGKRAEPQARQHLQRALRDAEEMVREEARVALHQLGELP